MSQFIYLVLGLIVGSFLNAVIHRLKSGESFINGRSKCPHCSAELPASDLIPILSFVLLGRRCRYCKKKISWQYPAVEALTALIFLLIGSQNGFSFGIEPVMALIFSSVFIVIGIFDLKHYLILDKVVFPFLALALVFALAIDISQGCPILSPSCRTGGGIISAIVVSVFFLLQYLISKGRWIGFGDVKFALLLGMVVGWPHILALLFLAYIIGAVVGLYAVWSGIKRMSSHLPFGSFLALSAIITMLYGSNLVAWYLGLIGFN
jgi:leader peptidase (prepilin peptidase)/N-methyltransferase